MADLEVQRAEAKAVAADHGALEPGDDRPRARRDLELELEAPRRPRLLHPLHARELALKRLARVLGLLLLASLAVAALVPLARAASLLDDSVTLLGVVAVGALLGLARPPSLSLELGPAARVDPHAPRLGLELEDARHAGEEGAIVEGHGHQAAADAPEQLSQLRQPAEVEIVGRLVE